MSKTMKQDPNWYNEIYQGEGKLPKTKHSKRALIIANFGDEVVVVETQSERGDTVKGVPPQHEMVLDARAGSFYTDGPVHVSITKLKKKDVEILDRLEDEDGKETYKKRGYRRPGHPCYVRPMKLYDKPQTEKAA